MTRVAYKPVAIPSGVEINLDGAKVSVKGPKGQLETRLHETVSLEQGDGELKMVPVDNKAVAMAGTFRSLINNMVKGVTDGFEKRLTLTGVGYRAQVQGNTLNLTLGYSHPIEYPIPEDVNIEAPSQTEVVVSGADKQRVGQVAAEIRNMRRVEPYKGKGVRYNDERVIRKEAKKK